VTENAVVAGGEEGVARTIPERFSIVIASLLNASIGAAKPSVLAVAALKSTLPKLVSSFEAPRRSTPPS
jgi:hypothetical protein